MDTQPISIKDIRIPKKHHRIKQDDGSMIHSMSIEGLKEPVVVVTGKNEFILADGYRRLKAAKKLRWPTIEASVRKPDGDPEEYASVLRLTINHHRQGFYPSQRAHYLQILTKKYNISINEIAQACGVTPSAAKNWLAVNDCSEEIKMFIDDGKFPIDSGRMINSLKPSGQAMVANKFRERPKVALAELQSFIRGIHNKYPEHIRIPLKTRTRTRAGSPYERSSYGRYRNMSIAELETKIDDLDKELVFMRREIIRATPIIRAICKNGKIRLLLPGDSLRKFESFLTEI